MGGWHSEEESGAATKAIRDSTDPTVGFGFICEEIEEFEAAFAESCGTDHGVSIKGAGTGVDTAIMWLTRNRATR